MGCRLVTPSPRAKAQPWGVSRGAGHGGGAEGSARPHGGRLVGPVSLAAEDHAPCRLIRTEGRRGLQNKRPPRQG